MELTSTQKKLAKARAQLVLAYPFVGSLALNMHFELNADIPSIACTDGETCWFKPSVVDELSGEELKFLVAHEVFHPMLLHNWRAKARNRKKWNRAGDYVINKLLTDEKIGTMPVKYRGLYDENIYAAGGGTTDGIYAILPDEPGDDGKGGGGNGSGNDPWDGDIEIAEGTPAEMESKAAQMKVKVAQAAQAAKMQGLLSKGLERFVGELLSPKVPWEEVLQRFLVRCKTDERSFARPARRFISQGMYLPSVSGTAMGEVVFAIDSSGSIGDKELAQFCTEAKKIKEDLNPSKMHIIYFHHAVYRVDTFEQGDELVFAKPESGGTDFAPIFKAVIDNEFSPVAIVVITDLQCDSFGDEPDCPVLWVSTHSDQAQFGEVIKM